jgi:tetratricopeptide (TPR) repeat protein
LNAEERRARPIRIVTEEEFCRLAGVPTPGTLKQQYHAMRDLLVRYRALREDHLRYLVKCGVLRPVLRTNADTFFAFPDVAAIKQANDGLARGASLRSVVRALIAMRQGQLEFDFRLDAAPAKILSLRRRRPTLERRRPSCPKARRRATTARSRSSTSSPHPPSTMEDDSTEEDAAAAYRKALEHDPYLVAAIINLANIHYSRDELVEAEALYTRAIGLEADFFEAHFNLGNIYHDLGRLPSRRRAIWRRSTSIPSTPTRISIWR